VNLSELFFLSTLPTQGKGALHTLSLIRPDLLFSVY
jgi:hypothetical protein